MVRWGFVEGLRCGWVEEGFALYKRVGWLVGVRSRGRVCWLVTSSIGVGWW